jgi:hypothetical protein
MEVRVAALVAHDSSIADRGLFSTASFSPGIGSPVVPEAN